MQADHRCHLDFGRWFLGTGWRERAHPAKRTGDAVNYTLAEERTATVLELPVDPDNWPTIEHGQDVLASL